MTEYKKEGEKDRADRKEEERVGGEEEVIHSLRQNVGNQFQDNFKIKLM